MNDQDRELRGDAVRQDPHSDKSVPPDPTAGASPRQAVWSWVATIAIVLILGVVFYEIDAQRKNATQPGANSQAVTSAPTSAAGVPLPAPDTTTGQAPAPQPSRQNGRSDPEGETPDDRAR